MTPKETKDREQLIQLEKENALLKEQVAGLKKRIGELEQAKPASKSRMQATELMHMLAEGPVPVDKLVKLNPKYPSDAVYYARTLLKADIKLVRRGGGLPNVYMLAKDFQTYSEGLKKEKAAQEASKQEAKEELTPAPTQAHSTATGHAAAV
jgi:hypothetical protein